MIHLTQFMLSAKYMHEWEYADCSSMYHTSLIVVLSHYIGPRKKTCQILCNTKYIIAKLFHCTMTISAVAAASPSSRHMPLQHWVRCNQPHCSIACNHPATWFSQICRISRELHHFYHAIFVTRRPSRQGGGKMGIYWL